MTEDTGNGNVVKLRLHQIEKSLERLHVELAELREEINKLKPRLSVVEVKSGMWGAIAGAVMVLGAILMQSL